MKKMKKNERKKKSLDFAAKSDFHSKLSIREGGKNGKRAPAPHLDKVVSLSKTVDWTI